MTSIPFGWSLKPLGEVATLQRGFDLPVNQRNPGNIPVLAANGQLGTHNIAKVKGPGVVTGRSGTLGEVHFVEDDYWPLNTALWVKDFHGNDPKWIARLLKWMKLETYTRGTGVPTLNRNLIHVVPVLVPPLEEQRRIAAILDKADAVRRKRKEAIALTEELLRSAFLDMFGDPVRNSKNWDVVSLGHISRVQGGLQVTTKRNINPIEVPYLRVANVYRDKLVLDEVKLIRVTQQELERAILNIGDLLIVEGHGNREEIGRSSVWDDSIPNCTHQNHLIRVRLDLKKAEPVYISAFLNSQGGRSQLTQFGKTTSGLNTISTSNVKSTKVLLPPLLLQKEYVKLKKNITDSKEYNYKYCQYSNSLFNSLLQRAFKGEL
ncbi:restriction endonuclease subunit S [Nostoc sp. CCY 9925]|uniref:restriction endonuclease subunit S n=1 Tax=Nostoc sp. CCY 9925 TaxID=3103865 RepID=UPI0039C6C1CF